MDGAYSIAVNHKTQLRHTVTAVFKIDSLILRIKLLCQKTTKGARIMKMAVLIAKTVVYLYRTWKPHMFYSDLKPNLFHKKIRTTGSHSLIIDSSRPKKKRNAAYKTYIVYGGLLPISRKRFVHCNSFER